MKFFYALSLLSIAVTTAQIKPTTPQQITEALNAKKRLEETSLVKNVSMKNIGPTVMSGRVADLEVNPNDPTEFYVGYASGGVWHTKNNGTSFLPILDNAPSINVGDIAVDWASGTIWVGTGENISSRSSYSGIGLLKSGDNGKTWDNKGLRDAHHFGRILINPKNPNELVVGVTGHLYSPNEERGIYKTIDGGDTWQKTLFVNGTTGIIDVAHEPNNFMIQYATAWDKSRKAWDFVGNGNASAIYKSTDAGTSWTKISNRDSGFPTGEGVGRIGLAVYDENTVYAVHDSQFRRPKKEGKDKKSESLGKDDFRAISVTDFQKLNNTKLDDYLKANNFPKKYTAASIKQMVLKNEVRPADLATYNENANSTMFNTPVVGAEVYRSDDAGKTWKKQNEDYIDDLFYSYGYVFAQVRVDPTNKDKIYLLGVPIIKSEDAGKTYTSINGENVHVDHHSLWVNPKMPGHLINGNDGGLNISYDDGEHWIKNNSEAVGTFFAINIDYQEPYNVYGGLQDNGVWMGPHNAEIDFRWQQTGHHPWKGIAGGDGMQIQIDRRNPSIIYTGSQFGYYSRLDIKENKKTFIRPKHELGGTPYRFNWETPILLSNHNQDILYLGTQKLLRSMNQGDDWEAISPDLTMGGKLGNVPYGTLTTISESPFQFGLLYTGSDDGLVQISTNSGGSWKVISDNFPKGLWTSTVLASQHKKNRVYVAMSGYRLDNFESYIYASDDFGENWLNISDTIPSSPVNVIIEDPENENLLFVGTDNGLYTSFDRGSTWEVFQNGMPNVAVHDLVIQPEAKHLLVGTHGRSIYRADISKLQLMSTEIMGEELHVFNLENIKYSENWGSSWNSWSKPQTPGLDITFYSDEAVTFLATIMSEDNIEVSSTEIVADKGFNVLSFDVAFSKAGKMNYLKKHKTELTEAKNGKTYLLKGTYTVVLKGNGAEEKKKFIIE